ncbi:MAG: extracellular solute-binding protein [Treponema sp.]|nr:extracellular solute-binding protein [Treponema sp.]
MINLRRTGIAALILILAAGAVFAGGGTQAAGSAQTAAPDSNFNPTGYPIVKEKITLTAFGNQNVTHKDWNDVYCFTEYEKMSNIHIAWTQAPNQGFAERRNVLMASGDYPDFFYRVGFGVSDIINYGSKGALIRLNDLIDQYAPNVKARMQEMPDMAKSMKMPDGNIYTLPSRSLSTESAVQLNWINKVWLDRLGLQVPTSLDEIEAVLTAFKTRDANGNGNPNDEIPYSDRNQGNSIFNSTNGAFGMGSLSTSQFGNYIDLGPDGKVRLFAISDNFRQQLEWITKLYANSLIDPEMFTQDIPTFTAKGEQDLIGAFFANNSPEIIGAKHTNDFVSAPPPKGPSGQAVFNNTGPTFGIGPFAISNQNKHVAETMRWIDFYYGEEGATMLWLGPEGVTWARQPDGSRRVTELVTNNPDGLNAPQSIGQYAIGWAGGGCPVFATDEMEKARLPAILYTSYDIVKPFIKLAAMPILSFTTAEQDELNPINSDMITYIDEAKVQFVTGRRPLSQWDAYVRDVKNMGADRYVAIYQAAYDRFSGK